MEVSRSERDSQVNTTILDGSSAGSVVQVLDPGYGVSTLDGFTVQKGYFDKGAGISCINSSPTLSNNRIIQNQGYGIYGAYFSGTVLQNEIFGNTGAGIYCQTQSSPKILNNQVLSNLGGGIICYSDCSPLIANCIIALNRSSAGAGIYCNTNSSPNIINNTIASNTLNGVGGGTGSGINCTQNCSPLLANNIVSFNGSGIFWDTSSIPSFGSNDVSQNINYDYMG